MTANASHTGSSDVRGKGLWGAINTKNFQVVVEPKPRSQIASIAFGQMNAAFCDGKPCESNLVFRALRKLHHYDRLILEFKRDHLRLQQLLG